jgi:hypothetical protein
MGLNNATLNGHRAISARVSLPSFGCWYADTMLDGDVTLSGDVTLVVADLTLQGHVLAGGPDKGRSPFRIVGGKGGWGKSVPRKSYNNDGGVKLSTVLVDAAQAAGELLDTKTIDSQARLGPAFVRPTGPAGRVLETVAPSAWHVGEDGVTRLGKRAASTFQDKAPRTTHIDKARSKVTLAAESISKLVPGVSVDGFEAVDVEHETSKDGLRTTIWGKRQANASRRLTAFRAILDQLDPGRAFRGVWEYRVVTQSGDRLNLQAVRTSSGMPDLGRVMVRSGVAGAKSMLTPGSRVLVGFVDEDPGRPVVLAFEDWDGSGFKPLTTSIDATTAISLAGGVLPTARTGDLAGGIFPVIGTAVKVLT